MGIDKLEVVRKLLAKAERAATPEEAESYTGMAMQLCARHGIDAALLESRQRADGHPPGGPAADSPGAQRIAVHAPYSAAKARLLSWTAHALRCRTVLHQARGGRVDAVTVVGFAADRARVELLYTSLLLQAGTQLVRARPSVRGESVAAYRRSWLHGFAQRVHQRLIEAEQAAADEAGARPPGGAGSPPATGVTVVLADRGDRVDRAFAEMFPGLQRARGQVLSGSGRAAGWEAGDRADLGGTGVAGAGRRALGA
jgi:hypothetical protein